MKKFVSFAQFEKASYILESKAPDDVDDSVLLENNITREELEHVNEGILGSLFGSFFKKIKEKVLKAIPGSTLKKIDEVLKEYKDAKMGIADKTLKERNKIYKSELTAKADPKDEIAKKRAEELKIRSDKAIAAIEEASKSKIDAINKKLQLLIKDKEDEFVKGYVDMQLAQIQEDVANKQLKDAEELGNEALLDEIEKDVKEAQKNKEEAQKQLEAAAKKKEAGKQKRAEAKEKKKKDEEEAAAKAKTEKEAKDKEEARKNAKEGQVWKRKSSDGIEMEIKILKAGNGYVQDWEVVKDYKNKDGKINKAGRVFKGAQFSKDQLIDLVSDKGEELKQAA